MSLTRQDFDELVCSVGTPEQEADARLRLGLHYDYMNDRVVNAEVDRNTAQLKADQDIRYLNSILSYEKTANRIIQDQLAAALNKIAKLETELAQQARGPIGPVQAFAEAEEKYALLDNNLLENAEENDVEISDDIDIIDDIGPNPTTITWKQVVKLHGRAVELRERLHEAIEQADVIYEPYRKAVIEARKETDKISQKLSDAQRMIRDLQSESQNEQKILKELLSCRATLGKVNSALIETEAKAEKAQDQNTILSCACRHALQYFDTNGGYEDGESVVKVLRDAMERTQE